VTSVDALDKDQDNERLARKATWQIYSGLSSLLRPAAFPGPPVVGGHLGEAASGLGVYAEIPGGSCGIRKGVLAIATAPVRPAPIPSVGDPYVSKERPGSTACGMGALGARHDGPAIGYGAPSKPQRCKERLWSTPLRGGHSPSVAGPYISPSSVSLTQLHGSSHGAQERLCSY
jgi:hypothetical protein